MKVEDVEALAALPKGTILRTPHGSLAEVHHEGFLKHGPYVMRLDRLNALDWPMEVLYRPDEVREVQVGRISRTDLAAGRTPYRLADTSEEALARWRELGYVIVQRAVSPWREAL